MVLTASILGGGAGSLFSWKLWLFGYMMGDGRVVGALPFWNLLWLDSTRYIATVAPIFQAPFRGALNLARDVSGSSRLSRKYSMISQELLMSLHRLRWKTNCMSVYVCMLKHNQKRASCLDFTSMVVNWEV